MRLLDFFVTLVPGTPLQLTGALANKGGSDSWQSLRDCDRRGISNRRPSSSEAGLGGLALRRSESFVLPPRDLGTCCPDQKALPVGHHPIPKIRLIASFR